MPSRRVEDRIEKLCVKLLNAENERIQAVGKDLHEALRQYFEHARGMISEGKPNRRVTSQRIIRRGNRTHKNPASLRLRGLAAMGQAALSGGIARTRDGGGDRQTLSQPTRADAIAACKRRQWPASSGAESLG